MKANLTRRQFLGSSGAALSGAAALAIPTSAAGATADPNSPKPYRFSYALNTGTIRGQQLGLADQIEIAAQAGYTGIEPWTGDIAKFVESGGSLADLGKRCSDLGLKVISAIGFAAWVVDDDQQRAKGVEQMKREMDMLARMGGTHIAAPPAGANRAGAKLDLDRAADRYRVILEAGRQIGVIPQVEVWGSSANLSHVAEAIYVAARSAHPDACVLADAFHMYKGNCDPGVLRLLSRQATHCFHMNDYPAAPARDVIKDSERIWPGDGIAPLKEILTCLAENHCQVILSVELFNPDYWKLPALEAAKTGLGKMRTAVAAAGLG